MNEADAVLTNTATGTIQNGVQSAGTFSNVGQVNGAVEVTGGETTNTGVFGGTTSVSGGTL
ncbi:hypothetical protein R0J91_22255, partial [Micrococcus sp. SIMBA_131]